MEQWKKSIYTDLAVEERESFPGDGGEIPGVSLREWEKEEAGIHLTEVVIKTEEGAGNMGKPMGTYVTLEALALAERDEDFHREVSEELAARSPVFWPFIRSEQTEMEERRPYWRWGWEMRTPHPTPWGLWC